MSLMISVRDVEKSYGRKKALQGVNMQIDAGQIVGLLGPNASGKTTLMKTVAGLLQPSGGEISYAGGAMRGVESKRTVAFLPDNMLMPAWMRVRDAFKYFDDIFPDFSHERASRMIELMGLDEHFDTNVKGLSLGMNERLTLALTFSREANLYLLDEPLGGIDPVGKQRVIDAIVAMELENASILISTHLVKDVEQLFDSVFFLSEGKIVFEGKCDEIRRQSGLTVEQKYLEVFSNGQAV